MAGISEPDFEKLRAIVETRDTELDLHGSGQPDLIRKFDADGFVMHQTFRHGDGTLETYDVSPDRQRKETRFDFPGGLWMTRTEFYDAGYQWRSQEIVYGRAGKAPDLKTVESAQGERKRMDTYRLKGSEWVLEETTFVSLIRARGSHRPPPVQPAAAPVRRAPLPIPAWTGDLQSCPAPGAAPSADSTGGCVFNTELLNPDRLDGLAALAPLECRPPGGRTVFLSNGFRLDLATCGETREALERAKAMTQKTFDVLKCVAGYNRDMARAILDHIAAAHPVIHCVGHLVSQKASDTLVPRACRDGSDEGFEKVCSQAALGNGTDGFAPPSSDQVYMTGEDPTLPYATASSSAETLTHELVHSTGLPEGELFHNRSDHETYLNALPPSSRERMRASILLWQQADPVYGVNVLCGGSPPGASADPTARNNQGVVKKLLDERGPIPLPPDGRLYTPPGSVFEMSCTALRQVRASHTCYSMLPYSACPVKAGTGNAADDARFNLRITAIDPECKDQADGLRRQILERERVDEMLNKPIF